MTALPTSSPDMPGAGEGKGQIPSGWTPYVRDDDPRPDVDWSGYIHDDATRGPAIACDDATGQPLFLVWWSDFGNGCSRITGWRPLPVEFDAPEWDRPEDRLPSETGGGR